MNNIFDNLCRILATPMPRKRALKLIGGGLIGAVMAPFAFGQKEAPSKNNCGAVNCSGGQTCCSGLWCCPGGAKCVTTTNPAKDGYCKNSNGKVVSPSKV